MHAPGHIRYSFFSQGIFVEQMASTDRILEIAKSLNPRLSAFELIRMGAPADGGYLVPADLLGVKACFSPGVDKTASFESDLLQYGIGSHLADYSVNSVPDGLQALSFSKKFIGGNTKGKYISLDDWVKELEPNAQSDELMLQMDVEGAEYESILCCSIETLKKFRIIVIEFHSVEGWGHDNFLNIVEATFTKLLNSHFVVHAHPNNAMGLVDMNGLIAPRIFELTFLSKTRSSLGSDASTPNPLDFPNVSNMPPLDWGQCWVPRLNT
jgi:hypothetical protein